MGPRALGTRGPKPPNKKKISPKMGRGSSPNGSAPPGTPFLPRETPNGATATPFKPFFLFFVDFACKNTTLGAPWGAHGAPMGRPWGASGAPMGRLWGAHGAPMGRPWGAHGAPMGRPWGAHGARMGRPWGAHGAPMGRPWGTHGAPMGHPWGAHGAPMVDFGSTRGLIFWTFSV